MNLATAKNYADKLVAWLSPYCERIEIAGSIRRERPNCNDVDLVCLPKLREEKDMLGAVISRVNFAYQHIRDYEMAGNCVVKSSGEHMMIVELKKCQLDLYFATPHTFATVLLCRTGSKEHNILLAQRAETMGGHWKPNAGLTLDGKEVYAVYEQQIYDALKLPWIEPRDRESDFVARLIHQPRTSTLSRRSHAPAMRVGGDALPETDPRAFEKEIPYCYQKP